MREATNRGYLQRISDRNLGIGRALAQDVLEHHAPLDPTKTWFNIFQFKDSRRTRKGGPFKGCKEVFIATNCNERRLIP